MAHRTPKINDTVKFTDQQQAILNDAAEQLMKAGGLTACLAASDPKKFFRSILRALYGRMTFRNENSSKANVLHEGI